MPHSEGLAVGFRHELARSVIPDPSARRVAGGPPPRARASPARRARCGRGPSLSHPAEPGRADPREVQVLGLIVGGLRNSEIAARLFLSEKTVDHHVSSVLRRLGVQTRRQAAERAVQEGIIEPLDSGTGGG
jgi:DNA-binding NarL/FixJ family response regulator